MVLTDNQLGRFVSWFERNKFWKIVLYTFIIDLCTLKAGSAPTRLASKVPPLLYIYQLLRYERR
jgi:hypothetical protein